MKLILDVVLNFPRCLWLSLQRFYLENTFSKAASLAYTTLLSLLPLVALLFGVLASFAVSAKFVDEVRSFIFRQFLPSTAGVNTVIEYLTKLSNLSAHPSFGVTMLISFFITAVLLINSIESSLNEIWQVFIPRGLAGRITTFCTMLLTVPVVMVSLVYFIRNQYLLNFLGDWSSIFTSLIPVLTDWVAFFALFYFVPAARVQKAPALIGSFLAAILFLFAKKIFALYVEQFASYDLLYGSISAIPVFLLWLYLAWVIVLFGAEIAFQYQFHGLSGAHPVRSVVALGVCGYPVAVEILKKVGQRFLNGDTLITEGRLSTELKASEVVLRPVIKKLYQAGLITVSSDGIAITKSPDMISMADVGRLYGVAIEGSPTLVESLSNRT